MPSGSPADGVGPGESPSLPASTSLPEPGTTSGTGPATEPGQPPPVGAPEQPAPAGSPVVPAPNGSAPTPAPVDVPAGPDGPVDPANPVEPTEPETEAPPTLLGDVAFSEPSQAFQGTLSVALSSTLAGEIRYTTDGSLPSASSTLYESPLVLDTSTELRAQVFPADGTPTQPSTGLYVARDFDATSDIPILLIDGYTGGKPTDKDTYRRAAFLLFEPVDGVATLSNLPTVATRSGHRLRGQSSQSHPKTPYRVELWDNHDDDADHVIAGMPAEADWALIHLYVDRSLVRNAFMYELGRQIGLAAPRQAFAEVYINHTDPVLSESHYQGVYNITEVIKNQKDRLNLQQLDEDDVEPEKLSGGYILSFEYEAVEGESIPCTGDDVFSRSAPGSFNPIPVTEGFCWNHLELRDPEPANPDQLTWITQYIQQFHDALHSEPLGAYEDFIDVASFVDFFLLTELSRDMDAYIRSAYFHKDRDTKLMAGPLWDFDLSMGAGGFFENLETAGWQVANRRIVHDWFIVLTRDPAFLERVGARWAELRQGPLSDASITASIDSLTAPLTAAALREHQKWSVSSVRTQYSVVEIPAGDTWEAQVTALRDWLLARAAWLDAEAGNSFTVPDYPFVP